MTKRTQWSIKRLLLWVFIAALVLAHASNIYQRQIARMTDFSIDVPELKSWVVELDPTATRFSGGKNSVTGIETVDCELDVVFVSKNSSSKEILAHLRSETRRRAKANGWKIHGYGQGSDFFNFHLSKGITHFRIYGFDLPDDNDPRIKQLKAEGNTVSSIKLLQIGYVSR